MGKMLIVVEMLKLLISASFSVFVYVVFIRYKPGVEFDKRFQALSFGIAMYIILRIISLSVYAYYGEIV